MRNSSFLAKSRYLIFMAILSLASCKEQPKKEESKLNNIEEVVESNLELKSPKKIDVILVSFNDKETTGKATFKAQDTYVTLTALVSGLASGNHPVYLEDKGTKFVFIGNLIADDNGDGTISFTSENFCLGCNDTIKNIIGKTITIYSGDSKTTVSCSGVIKPK